ncbi:MAG: hypothetical protein B7Z15_09025 [Rhizobiales bacterium 32-66-8]|nr:MAG: hypothetical protein B7Z15_09025 [Rhizobiales bacterium 32-66-8]
MYQVTLAFRETRTNLIFIKLRNPWKTHVRDYSFKDKDGFAVLSPEQADQMTKGHWLEAKAGGFKPGEFVVELSDFAKRFDAINYM